MYVHMYVYVYVCDEINNALSFLGGRRGGGIRRRVIACSRARLSLQFRCNDQEEEEEGKGKRKRLYISNHIISQESSSWSQMAAAARR